MYKEIFFRSAVVGQPLGDGLMVLQHDRTGEIAFVVHKDTGTPQSRVVTMSLPADAAADLAVAITNATFPFLPTSRR